MFQCLKIHNTALRFFGSIDGSCFQDICIFA